MATRKNNTAQAAGKGGKPAESEEMAVYQIKVSLLDTKPLIWRRLLIPAGTSLAQLHRALQITMGWKDMHMHEFRAADRRFGHPEPADPIFESPAVEDERKARFSDVFSKAGEKILYIYDFGDDWVHEIKLEKLLPTDVSIVYPVCVDGRLACPPEDCGGIPGYYDLLNILAKPSHRSYKETREWLGGDFHPEEFSCEEVNRLLAPQKRAKKSSLQ